METTITPLEAALEYADAGLPVLPLHSINNRGHCTCGNKLCSNPGKHPRTRNGLKDATTDEKKIKSWWGKGRWPNASIGGVGGDFLCLDIDPKASGHESLEDLIADNAPLPDTAVVETGQVTIDGDTLRGRHYWFRVPDGTGDVATRAGIRPGIDVRCYRGYAVLPPSPHYSGVNYEWVDEDTIVDAAPVPEWLLDLVPEVVHADANWAPDPNFKQAKEVRQFLTGDYEPEMGEQRDFLTRAARSVLTTGKDVEETTSLLYEGHGGQGGISASDQNPDDLWREDQVLALVEDVYRAGPSSGMKKDFSKDDGPQIYNTDMGNAMRLVSAYKDGELFHVEEWKKWYLWDGGRFQEDVGSTLERKFQLVTEEMVQEAFNQQDEAEIKRTFQHAMRSQSRPRVEAAVALARSMARQRVSALNADPLKLNVQNGVVDLRTGDLLDPKPEYLMTKQARCEYHPGATSSTWQTFLDRVVPDPDLQAFLKKAFGYTLTGLTDEHKFFYLHGPPASGKSTILETFSRLLGNYSETAEPGTFMRNPNKTTEGPSEDLARLANARMVVTSEVEAGARFAEGHISKLTGGDTVVARFLHASSFTFQPQFKLWFSANHKPNVTGSSRSGIWRRILIVPMEVEIPEKERDPSLARRLRQPDVMSAVLAWAVEGAREWHEDYEAHQNMAVPQVMRDEVDQYKLESDHVAIFIKECLVVDPEDQAKKRPDKKVSKKDLFEVYQGWCEKEGRQHRLTRNKLTRELGEHGLVWRQLTVGGTQQEAWAGVKVKGLTAMKTTRG